MTSAVANMKSLLGLNSGLASSPEEQRRDAILALPEAVGRKPLANALLVETTLSVDRCRNILALAGRDPNEPGFGAARMQQMLGADGGSTKGPSK